MNSQQNPSVNQEIRSQYDKFVKAAKRLAGQAADQYVDACGSLTTGFVVHVDGMKILEELPTRYKYKKDHEIYQEIQEEIITDRDSRFHKEKTWTRTEILNGNFHKYFDPKEKKNMGFEEKYNIYVPEENNKDIFYPTMNAIIASEMLNTLEYKKDKDTWTKADYESRINDTKNLYIQKRDLHKARQEADVKNKQEMMTRKYDEACRDFQWGRRRTAPSNNQFSVPDYQENISKSYDDCLKEQMQNPVITLFRKVLKGITSLFTNNNTIFSAPGSDMVSRRVNIPENQPNTLNVKVSI